MKSFVWKNLDDRMNDRFCDIPIFFIEFFQLDFKKKKKPRIARDFGATFVEFVDFWIQARQGNRVLVKSDVW